MKTIRLARTIRRQLPGGLLAWIGPEGVRIRQKRSVPLYSLSWKEVWERAQFLGVTAPADVHPRSLAEQVEMFVPGDATRYYQAGDGFLLDAQRRMIEIPRVDNPPEDRDEDVPSVP